MMGKLVRFLYRNHRGAIGLRTVEDPGLWFGHTEHHPAPQWFLRGGCCTRGEVRDFALADVIRFLTDGEIWEAP